jgi:glutamate 5-kinase
LILARRTPRATLREAHRLVVKVGTQVVTTEDSELAVGRVTALVEGLARERKAGRDVVLVTSGAVGMGMRLLGLGQRPRSLGLRQACAAVGQGHLMAAYADAFAKQGVIAAQVLLTQEDLGRPGSRPVRAHHAHAPARAGRRARAQRKRQREHPRAGRVPAPLGRRTAKKIFGDNDGLAARVAVTLDADLLVLLTNVDGLFTANPKTDPKAERIALLTEVDESALGRASGSSAAVRVAC